MHAHALRHCNMGCTPGLYVDLSPQSSTTGLHVLCVWLLNINTLGTAGTNWGRIWHACRASPLPVLWRADLRAAVYCTNSCFIHQEPGPICLIKFHMAMTVAYCPYTNCTCRRTLALPMMSSKYADIHPRLISAMHTVNLSALGNACLPCHDHLLWTDMQVSLIDWLMSSSHGLVFLLRVAHAAWCVQSRMTSHNHAAYEQTHTKCNRATGGIWCMPLYTPMHKSNTADILYAHQHACIHMHMNEKYWTMTRCT